MEGEEWARVERGFRDMEVNSLTIVMEVSLRWCTPGAGDVEGDRKVTAVIWDMLMCFERKEL